MHRETIRDMIESGSGAIGALAKGLFIHRNEMQQMEKKKDMEVELAKAKREATTDREPTEPQATAPETDTRESVGVGAELEEAFADLKAREQCGICRELLEGIEQADHETQLIALTEYVTLKDALDRNASEAEIRDILEESHTLADLLEQQVGG